MASSRLPGPIGASEQPPIDFRTLQLAATPPPGPVDGNATESSLDTADIESLELFKKSLKYRSLEELQDLRFKNKQLYEQAVRDGGARSSRATFWASSLDILDKHIALGHSSYGKAKERLLEAIEALKNGTPVKDDDVRKAVSELLGAERQKQLLGIDEDSETMSLVAEAHTALAEVKIKQFKELLEKAKQPGTNVTVDQISKEIGTLLGLEREKQLLGIDDGNSETMSLIAEAHTALSQIKIKQFKELLQKAKQPGSNVTDDQMRTEIGTLLGLERQKQLLGIEDNNSETMSLVGEALDIAHERRLSGLSELINKAKSGKQKVTKEQMQAQVVLVLESERQRQLMGVSDPGNRTGELLEQARSLMSTVEVKIGPVTVEKRG